MTQTRISTFKDPVAGPAFLQDWNQRVMQANGASYTAHPVETRFGKTHVWAHTPQGPVRDTLVFLPGARTCGLFWDLDHVLAPLKADYQIWIPDVNGQPGLSAGNCPAIKGNDYGLWAEEVFNQLKIENATVIGASQGGLIGLKLCLQAPERVKQLVLMNPGGIQPFSTRFKNLYYNFMPMLFPSDKNIRAFFDQVILHPQTHQLSAQAYQFMLEYMRLALKEFKFAGDYPSPLPADELKAVTHPIHLVLGDQDLLFPTAGTVAIAQSHFQQLSSTQILPGFGHGIETSQAAITALQKLFAREL
jgi:pimeloyl-ACP methyl ester carboxylesterase